MTEPEPYPAQDLLRSDYYVKMARYLRIQSTLTPFAQVRAKLIASADEYESLARDAHPSDY